MDTFAKPVSLVVIVGCCCSAEMFAVPWWGRWLHLCEAACFSAINGDEGLTAPSWAFSLSMIKAISLHIHDLAIPT